MHYYLLTLGCPKNLVDSEGMAMTLESRGYALADTPEKASVLIVNTCGFLRAAEDESLSALRELAAVKRPGQLLIAAGCMAQRDSTEILRQVPQVDGLLGTRRWMEIVRLVEALRNGRKDRQRQCYQLLGEPEITEPAVMPRPPVVGSYAYLKISDGCSAPCAFCTIPSFKGKLRSRPFAAVVEEAKALVASGAKELIVIAQDTTDYGRDRGEPGSLPRLLNAIANRAGEGLRWLRLMYAYPGHVSDALIEVMAGHERIVHYLDIPLQHAHPATLRRMRRPGNVDQVMRTLEQLRAAMPDIALRTTFIVGYPGETEAEFQALLDFVQTVQFDRMGVFKFSPEPGTPAAEMPGQVPEAVREERYQQLMELQQGISLRRNQLQVGRQLDVLIEGVGDGISLGRSYRDAPEVDGLVLIPGELLLGEMVRVRITGAMEYDLVGERVAQ
ncbi:MAG TPA: 30S ribosomal protein S12 methylthiotransferase RimO [Anaerolineae bacterium]|nr:30S ribosomal protein S12 methylthiotransferase RimO [Anaerolineae bacterium]HIQ05410.1 30S ribosomal protein S12 methylthiotransferase RimO [Anaerolineae bacterium]